MGRGRSGPTATSVHPSFCSLYGSHPDGHKSGSDPPLTTLSPCWAGLLQTKAQRDHCNRLEEAGRGVGARDPSSLPCSRWFDPGMIARTTPASHALLRCCTLFHRCFRVAESKLAPACIMCTHRTQTTLNLLGFMVMILK